MKDEIPAWLSYADENLDVAELSLANNHLNACLHNTQQAVEKYLKALIIEYDLPFRKTHAIYVLWQELTEHGIQLELTEEDCRNLSMKMRHFLQQFSVAPDRYLVAPVC